MLNASRIPLTNRKDSLTKLAGATQDAEARKALRTQFKEIDNEEKQLDQGYVQEHPRSLISAYLPSVYASTWGKERSQALYSNLIPEIKATGYGRDIHDFITLNKNLKLGDEFADFEQTNQSGRKIKFSDIKGKYILLDFWASWCVPCREENPALVKTYKRFKDKGIAILSVSLDDKKALWLKAIKDDKLIWENVSDLKGYKNRAALMYGVSFVPNNFLIN